MINIVPYKPTWPDEFQQIGTALRSALGNLALRIDHIGSTSVRGLAAKDVIDIQVTAVALSDPIEQGLNRAGFTRLTRIDRDHVPAGSTAGPEQWVKWFFKPAADPRPVNLHVRLAGRANQRYPLLFRDYLRAHPTVAQAYAETKKVLALRDPEDVDAYYAVKDPVCDIIAGGAEAWARQVGWRVGPSGC